jgi:hypothetical protein
LYKVLNLQNASHYRGETFMHSEVQIDGETLTIRNIVKVAYGEAKVVISEKPKPTKNDKTKTQT